MSKHYNEKYPLVKAPCYAVIFTSQLSDSVEGYAEMAQQMEQLAMQQDGFLGIESVRENRTGITVSYWKDEKSILQWRQQLDHQQAQSLGRARWYESYSVQISRIERAYQFEKNDK